jgi:UDP-N-acetylmuramoylalanine--D-glutamate ligase
MLPAGDMRKAVALAREHATTGSVVLLSPAAPSYNAYTNFEQRGEDFAALARASGPNSPTNP